MQRKLVPILSFRNKPQVSDHRKVALVNKYLLRLVLLADMVVGILNKTAILLAQDRPGSRVEA